MQPMKSIPSILQLLLLLSLALLGSVQACSCLGPIDLNATLTRVDSVLQVMVTYEVFPSGRPSDTNYVPFRYWEAILMNPPDDVKVGCEFGNMVLIRTGENSAACGVNLQPFTPTLIAGLQSFEMVQGYHYYMGPVPLVDVNLCDFNAPVSELSAMDQVMLDSLPEPDCTCDPSECTAEEPGTLCPDGVTNSSVVCGKKLGACDWIYEDCPTCESDQDCLETQYCQDSHCRADGTCETTVDCFNPANSIFGPQEVPDDCVLDLSCNNNNECEYECCSNVFNCFAQPCAVTECDLHDVRCVDNYCNACSAIFFDRAGNNVCTGTDPTECTPNDCTAPSPVDCPDGSTSVGTGNCVYDTLAGECVPEVTGCPSCTTELDCPDGQFCSNGLCRLDGTCSEDHDCYNSNNDLGSIITCVAERTCDSGICNITCCTDETLDECTEQPPCDTPCDQDYEECFKESCSSCDPIFINAAGFRVCQVDSTECTPDDCGPPPPGAPLECPDGSIGGISGNCIYNPASQSCEFEVIECPTCASDGDCPELQFCSEGLCRLQGTCGSRGDCWNPSNDLGPIIACIAERECLGGTCDIECCSEICDISPCEASECPELTCVDSLCADSCEAIHFADDGSVVACGIPSEEGCQEQECGPVPGAPLQPCPDGTPRTYVCEEIGDGDDTCVWQSSECPVPCVDNSDCDESEYCASDGNCIEDSKCTVVADCDAAGNDFEFGPLGCVYLIYCTDGDCVANCV